MSNVCHRGLALVLSLALVAPQGLVIAAGPSQNPAGLAISANCAEAVPAMESLKNDLDADAGAAEMLTDMKDAAARGQAPPADDLNAVTEDVMTSLESATRQVDEAIYRTGNRIEALNLGRPQRQIWNEHTRSVRGAANRFRTDVRRVPRSGTAMRFVNGRAVRAPQDQRSQNGGRAAASTRPAAATEPFNQMFRSATGYWTAVDEMMHAADQGGLAGPLAGNEGFMNLQAQAPRVAENVEMLGMARSLAGAGLGSIDSSSFDRKLEEARSALGEMERNFSAPCAQQNAGAGITKPSAGDAAASQPPPDEGGGIGGWIALGIGVPVGLYGLKYWEDHQGGADGGGNCPLPSLSADPCFSQGGNSSACQAYLSQVDGYCACKGMKRGSGTAGFNQCVPK